MKSTAVPIETVSGDSKDRKKRLILGGSEIAQLAKKQIARLTELEPGRVSGLSRDGDGWCVTVDVVELKRIPDSADVLGTYEALVDDEGNLISYKRIRRYCRGEVMEES